MDNQTIAQLAAELAVYHHHSLQTRSYGMMRQSLRSPHVNELENLAIRYGNGWTQTSQMAQVLALRDAMRDAQDEVKDLVAAAKEAVDARPMYERAKVVEAQMRGALTLLELLNG